MTALLSDLAISREATVSGFKRGTRLLVLGNRIDRPALFDIVEKAGGSIAVFDTCNGLKHYTDLVENSMASLEALARRYLLKPSCPRMPGFEARLERVKHLVREFRVQGIIYRALKFCDYGLFETPQVEKLSKELGLPALVLEDDYVWADIGRSRTRVEAFLEMVRR
jgi:benzoyl-CoA reductase/2-hydroxyglutaryl-CoA dehydratase subunit BcrC/BadD/HgdB